MAITRSTLLLRSRQWADAVDATLDWPDTLLLDTASFVFLDEWKKLLGAAPYYQTVRSTVTLDSSARFTLASLNSGSGDSAITAHRILQLASPTRGDFLFTPAHRVNLTVDHTKYQGPRLWTRVGTEVQVVGVGGETTLNAIANYIPAAPNVLDGDSSVIAWPAGYETLLYMETAALMLAKAGRETNEALDVQRQAEVVRSKMHQEFAHDSSMPFELMADDDPREWGG